MATVALRPGIRGVHGRRGIVASPLPAFACALSLSAAIAHLGVAVPHWREWVWYGVFFVACGVAQAALAVLIVRWPRAPALGVLGIAGNLAIVSMYVYSRTNGPPLGPHTGVPEAPAVFDVVTTSGEVLLVVVLVA